VIGPEEAAALAACVTSGGVAVFPADTVYGLACDPEDKDAIDWLYALKARPPEQPSAVMFFSVQAAETATPWLGPRTRAALAALLPGAVTLLLPNPERRYPLAATGAGGPLGLRVPDLPAFAHLEVPVLQSSANYHGAPDARRLEDVPADIRSGTDLALDGGELPGTPSTIVDLRAYEAGGVPTIVREGAVTVADVLAALASS
jgi:L-threonylcarbamoyladenylate synthase